MGELDEQLTAARAAREALVGQTIAGRYVLRGLIGHGGMGAVYEAEHVGIGKRVAIKFVDPEFATDERVVARFAREARAMSAIESAHIVTVFDAGTEDGRPFLIMELLRGEDLGQRLRRTRRVPLDESLHVVAQILKGLARAHAAGIVHRDLKPDNVFLVKGESDPLFAKIVDFGVSKIERPRANTSPLALTGRGTVLGTPFYMSPEQAQASSDVDGRADLYSVGAILFECLTGRPPHTGESYEQVILSICMRDAPDLRAVDPSVSPEVAAFVSRALARDRDQRFTSAERMLAALHELAPDEKTRVPLDVVPETLASPGVQPPSASLPSSPLNETRLIGSIGGADADESIASSARATPTTAASPSRPEHAPSDAGLPSKSGPRRRSFAPVLATAVAATLLGVGVTFAIIFALDKHPSQGVGPLTTHPSSHVPAPGSSEPANATSVTNAVASSASSPAPPPSTPPAGSSGPAQASTVTIPKPPSSGPIVRVSADKPPPPPPKPPSSKGGLDIQRDLP